MSDQFEFLKIESIQKEYFEEKDIKISKQIKLNNNTPFSYRYKDDNYSLNDNFLIGNRVIISNIIYNSSEI